MEGFPVAGLVVVGVGWMKGYLVFIRAIRLYRFCSLVIIGVFREFQWWSLILPIVLLKIIGSIAIWAIIIYLSFLLLVFVQAISLFGLSVPAVGSLAIEVVLFPGPERLFYPFPVYFFLWWIAVLVIFSWWLFIVGSGFIFCWLPALTIGLLSSTIRLLGLVFVQWRDWPLLAVISLLLSKFWAVILSFEFWITDCLFWSSWLRGIKRARRWILPWRLVSFQARWLYRC